MQDFEFDGATAVVTGAAGGMGAELSRILAGLGTHLALVDRDAAGLGSLAGELSGRHPHLTVTTHIIDLGVHSDFATLVSEVEARHERVSLLINNAGVALGGRFAELSLDDIDWIMSINFRAVVAMTKAFLPALTGATGSHLVNTSSLFGLIAPIGQSAYSASKFAVRGLSESLRGELGRVGVGVTVVHPGGVATNIAANARLGAGVDPESAERRRAAIGGMLTMPAAIAAQLIVDAVRTRRGRLVITHQAKMLDRLARLMPSRHIGIIARVMSGRRR